MKPTEDKRSAVLSATLRLISAQGFHGTPMAQIAKESGTSAGIIYHYFENKEDLLNQLYLHVKTKCAEQVLTTVKENAAAENKIRQILRNIFYYYIENWDELSFAEQYENSPLIQPATATQVSKLLEPVIRLFEQALSECRLKPLGVQTLLTLSFGAVSSLAKLYIFKKMSVDDRVIQKELEAIWDMIKI
jgi:AcrR family transcriptional regulator